MRTKALILAAAASVAGIAAVQAQSNVYSVNVVGYYNVTIQPAPSQFKMIANQLNTTNNTLNGLIAGVPPGTIFLNWNGTGFTPHEYIDDTDKWDPNFTLNPGDGGFLRNVTASPMTVTFVGEVPQGSLTNPIPANTSIEASVVPQGGAVQSVLGLPVVDGEVVLKWKTTAGGGYTPYEFISAGDGWDPSEPTVEVGESFFTTKSGPAQNWIRNFTVPNSP
jgi:hypothetical protein